MCATSDGTSSGNGSDKAACEIDRVRLLTAIEDAYGFPCFFPVVLIAKSDLDFRVNLDELVEAIQGDADFEILERESREGNYVSYRVELHVASAEQALDRKAQLSSLPGVLMAL